MSSVPSLRQPQAMSSPQKQMIIAPNPNQYVSQDRTKILDLQNQVPKMIQPQNYAVNDPRFVKNAPQTQLETQISSLTQPLPRTFGIETGQNKPN